MSKPYCFSQYIRLPLIGTAWVVQEPDRPLDIPFCEVLTDRDETPIRAIMSVTVRVGRWVGIADHPLAPGGSPASEPQGHNRHGPWLAAGAPTLLILGLVTCLLMSLLRWPLWGSRSRPSMP